MSDGGPTFEISGYHIENVDIEFDEAVRLLTNDDDDPDTDQPTDVGDVRGCGTCGVFVFSAERHARYHAAVAAVAEYVRDNVSAGSVDV